MLRLLNPVALAMLSNLVAVSCSNSSLIFSGGLLNITGNGLYAGGTNTLTMTAGTLKNTWWEVATINNLTVNLSGTAILDNTNGGSKYIYSGSTG